MKYKQYAGDIAALIASGHFQPGQQLPSVRDMGRQRGLSPVTVLKAYHRLEAQGLIVARERSGFYVAERNGSQLVSPRSSRPSRRATPVSKSDFIFEILQSSRALEVVPLGSAFPSPLLFPHARLNRSLRRAMKPMDPWRSVTDLTPGSDGLRRQIALRYQIAGMALDNEELVITDGAMEGLNLCLQVVTRPGDTVVIESPTFYAALQALERLGLRAIEVATDPVHGLDVDALEQVLQHKRPAACWVMSQFQNPTGASMPHDNKARLVKLLATYDVPLIEDDTYGELYFQSQRPLPLKAFDQDGGVLHCSSLSKCLAPGYRVGWAAAGRYTEQVQRLKLGLTISTSLPAQLALEDYLAEADYDRHLKSFRAALQQGRDALVQAVHSFFPEQTHITRPQGGYFLWLELPPGVSGLELYRRALAKQISIAPGEIFSAREDFSQYVRLNYGHPEDRRINRALKTLGELVAQLQAEAGATS
jgi:DNA-binding transcriptional MocR family regulator